MSELKALRLKLLRETLEHYNDSNRSLIEEGVLKGRCVYVHPDGERRCAVGRIIDERTVELARSRSDINRFGVATLFRNGGHLIEEYQKLEEDVDFLMALQGLHDNDFVWDSKGFKESKLETLVQRMSPFFWRDEIEQLLNDTKR